MPEPGVVADRHLVAAPPLEERFLVTGIFPVVRGAVGEVVQRRPPGRMVGGVYADGGGDVGELADLGAPDAAVLHQVGIVSDRALADAAAFGNLGVAAERRIADLGGGMDQWFDGKPSAHAAAFPGAKRVTSMTASATASRTSWSWKMPSRATPAAFFSSIISITTWRFLASSEAVGSSSRSTG